MPPEIRTTRWFGHPWPSGVCYEDDGRLRIEDSVPFPDGLPCAWCTEPFVPGESGVAIPSVHGDGSVTPENFHKECMIRMTIGSVAHLEHRCSCHGQHEENTLTARQDAQATWDWIMSHTEPFPFGGGITA